mmetsp:Transcript_92176/g.176716  ORF Transcript_92176/g.176716 Transcript_92176/m.176716 type:complete len:388 (+) Transcript_92176:2038-3201(+)
MQVVLHALIKLRTFDAVIAILKHRRLQVVSLSIFFVPLFGNEVMECHLTGLRNWRRFITALVAGVEEICEAPDVLVCCESMVQLVTHVLGKVIHIPSLDAAWEERQVADNAGHWISHIHIRLQLAHGLGRQRALCIHHRTSCPEQGCHVSATNLWILPVTCLSVFDGKRYHFLSLRRLRRLSWRLCVQQAVVVLLMRHGLEAQTLPQGAGNILRTSRRICQLPLQSFSKCVQVPLALAKLHDLGHQIPLRSGTNHQFISLLAMCPSQLGKALTRWACHLRELWQRLPLWSFALSALAWPLRSCSLCSLAAAFSLWLSAVWLVCLPTCTLAVASAKPCIQTPAAASWRILPATCEAEAQCRRLRRSVRHGPTQCSRRLRSQAISSTIL